ncbi:hypothetical protein OGAPHI_004230 [Ogataea philodendri]|uniref:Uncharacterized protein n=1 Tax=Ogataea philodendri TaxID=1378263 RepID=A0A9P8P6P9_9ASCO|nr:uncharacterized protein OGAPHI_004230 [Ogataea philodendri]KAH3666041.1 hypothetical protein OGAPHI_004230 [Ogataea philodendri]
MVVSNSRTTRSNVNFLGTGFSSHRDDFLGGGSSHNGVVHQKNRFPVKLGGHRVQLPSHRRLSLFLIRHDESSSNVSVLDETFSVRNVQCISALQGGVTRGVGHRNNNVDFFAHVKINFFELLGDVLSELGSHFESGSVDTDTIQNRIWSCKIHVFKDVWGIGLHWNNLLELRLHGVLRYYNSFTGQQVSVDLEPVGLQNNRFGGKHIVFGSIVFQTLSNQDRTDTMRISETNDTVTGQHRNTSVSSSNFLENTFQGLEQITVVDSRFSVGCKLAGKQVQQKFRVRVSIDMSMHNFVHVGSEFFSVGQVTVVTQCNTTHVTDKSQHSLLSEHITGHSVTLALVQSGSLSAGDNTCCVLTSVLKKQASIKQLRCAVLALVSQYNSQNSTHSITNWFATIEITKSSSGRT